MLSSMESVGGQPKLTRYRRWWSIAGWYAGLPLAAALHWLRTFKLASADERRRRKQAEWAKLSHDPAPTVPAQFAREQMEVHAPPGVPYDIAIVRTSDLRSRFGVETKTRSRYFGGHLSTHNDLPFPSLVVLVMFTDVAADYYVESAGYALAAQLNERCRAKVAIVDIPFMAFKEIATAAGLGVIGKNALFYSSRFGFNCKITVIGVAAHFDEYTPVGREHDRPDGWKLSACADCNICVEACPVSAFDDFAIQRRLSCDRVISADFFGPNRTHMCRACITSCPPSNDLLKQLRRDDKVPRLMFWDDEAQLNEVTPLVHRPSIWLWIIQRFFYGAGIPGHPRRKAAQVEHTGRTRNGWVDYVRRMRAAERAQPAPAEPKATAQRSSS